LQCTLQDTGNHQEANSLKISNEPSKEKYVKILNLDESIRFVGRIKNRNVVSFVRRNDLDPLLDDEMGNMAHYQA
jgi:hypothetical protein